MSTTSLRLMVAQEPDCFHCFFVVVAVEWQARINRFWLMPAPILAGFQDGSARIAVVDMKVITPRRRKHFCVVEQNKAVGTDFEFLLDVLVGSLSCSK